MAAAPVTLALCGDVMTGRGIDQVLPQPCDPVLYEPSVESAEEYVALAERVGGAIPRPMPLAGPWGDALDELERAAPDARIVNLETALTRSPSAWPGKLVHYRTSPENAALLSAARIDVCALANNHVLDWGVRGLEETLARLGALGIRHAGAGADRRGAEAPAEVPLGARGRLLVFSFASPSSGVPAEWAAGPTRPGVALLPDLSPSSVRHVAARVAAERRPADRVMVSLHWGGNWGFAVSPEERAFAHGLIDHARVDLLHGHSSHHVRPLEVYRGRLILYGCGDFLNDYEGISGCEEFRGDLGLLYLPSLDPASGALLRLLMTPTRISGFRVRRAAGDDVDWLIETLRREGRPFGTSARRTEDGRLELQWPRERASGAG